MYKNDPPYIGNWYKNQEVDNIFEVVAADEAEGYVEIQYFTGEIDELDLEFWYELDIRQVPAPEDWSGPFELSREDLDYFEETFHPEDWSGPLTDLEPDDYY